MATNTQTPAEVRRIASGRDWFGFLTLENLNAVADRIRSMIGDGQRYTWVACNEGLGDYRPEVRTSQVAAKIRVDRRDDEHGSIIVVDTYGVWSIHTDIADQAAGMGRQPEFSLTYLKITRGQIQMEHKAPIGARLLWTVALEGGDA
ncbi:hypothetical protein [Actinomadura sp. WMMA1423]|uniref:hypothetical protein n=1 Tax=Actinomadura sp. WMMA1423 TaxID=2591108 RepID=UPI0011475A99|nr:hypothetical protein [Actinomadura sp. WMMA1423]